MSVYMLEALTPRHSNLVPSPRHRARKYCGATGAGFECTGRLDGRKDAARAWLEPAREAMAGRAGAGTCGSRIFCVAESYDAPRHHSHKTQARLLPLLPTAVVSCPIPPAARLGRALRPPHDFPDAPASPASKQPP